MVEWWNGGCVGGWVRKVWRHEAWERARCTGTARHARTHGHIYTWADGSIHDHYNHGHRCRQHHSDDPHLVRTAPRGETGTSSATSLSAIAGWIRRGPRSDGVAAAAAAPVPRRATTSTCQPLAPPPALRQGDFGWCTSVGGGDAGPRGGFETGPTSPRATVVSGRAPPAPIVRPSASPWRSGKGPDRSRERGALPNVKWKVGVTLTRRVLRWLLGLLAHLPELLILRVAPL